MSGGQHPPHRPTTHRPRDRRSESRCVRAGEVCVVLGGGGSTGRRQEGPFRRAPRGNIAMGRHSAIFDDLQGKDVSHTSNSETKTSHQNARTRSSRPRQKPFKAEYPRRPARAAAAGTGSAAARAGCAGAVGGGSRPSALRRCPCIRFSSASLYVLLVGVLVCASRRRHCMGFSSASLSRLPHLIVCRFLGQVSGAPQPGKKRLAAARERGRPRAW